MTQKLTDECTQRHATAATAAAMLIQAMLGLEFLLGGLNKLFAPDYVAHFEDFVSSAPSAQHGAFAQIVQVLVLPHFGIMAQLARFTELSAGIVLLVTAAELARRQFTATPGRRLQPAVPLVTATAAPTFQMRTCYSGRVFVRAVVRATQQAFLECMVLGLEYFGGVFTEIRVNNHKSAVARVLRGRTRQESDGFIALRSHYLFESRFGRLGEEGAHEKGGVEGGIGHFRRSHLVPLPSCQDFGVPPACPLGGQIHLDSYLERALRYVR